MPMNDVDHAGSVWKTTVDYLSTGGTTGIATGRSKTGICNWKVVRTCEF